jgi:leucine dehydrogenase
MDIIQKLEQGSFEQVLFCVDRDAGLRAFIAIHDTTLGPALGGCRVWSHPSEEAALTDVLRLAKGMTYKNAAAGLNLGGGKALIWTDPQHQKNQETLRSFGRYVEKMGGTYITTEDVGTTPEDLVVIKSETDNVVGLPISLGGSGDPSKATGWGVYQGIRACAKEAFGSDSLAGMSIAIQGYGKVASYLVEHLIADQASVAVTDVDPRALARATEQGLTIIEDPETIYDFPCQIFSPCAMGGSLNEMTIPRLQCRIVAGSANNQLLTPRDGDTLHRQGILYAPDYVINAGGVINLSYEMGMDYQEKPAMEHVGQIREAMEKVIHLSKTMEIATYQAADKMAEERLSSARPH